MRKSTWIEPSDAPAWSSRRIADPLLRAILARRFGSEDEALTFLDSGPFQAENVEPLPNMVPAVERIARAIRNRERMVVCGDYDVDGVAATAVVVHAIRTAGGDGVEVGVRIPTRQEGYGLRPEVVREVAKSGASLLIAVDCGSSDQANVALARELGMDVVVFDHHQLTGAPVDAIVVSPQLSKLSDLHGLSASGIGYLFAAALARAGFDAGAGAGREPRNLLDLAALGLVADVMPLTGIVRPLVRDGLDVMRTRPRPGLRHLIQRAGLTPELVNSEDVAFRLAPRLNAAGRVDNPRVALGLLLTEDDAVAAKRVGELEGLNQVRRIETERVAAEAVKQVRAMPDLDRRLVLVAHAAGWTAGILGIVAAQLVELFGRPALVLCDAEGVSRGSARSVPGFDIGRAIDASAGMLLAHGGHGQAAGLTVATTDLPELVGALEEAARQSGVTPVHTPTIVIDADLPVDRLQRETADLLAILEPFGMGNPRPLLRVSNARLNSYRSIGADGRHLKLFLGTPQGEVGVLAWNASGRSRELVGQRWLDLVVTLGVDTWNGQRRLQAVVKDFRAG